MRATASWQVASTSWSGITSTAPMVVEGKRSISVWIPRRRAVWATVSIPTSSHPSLMAIMFVEV